MISASAIAPLACVLMCCGTGHTTLQGADASLRVATWNVEWFGSIANGPSDEEEQLRNVAQVILASDVDLWALQEIDKEAAFEQLLDELGSAYGGVLASSSTNFRYGFVYRRDALRPLRVSDAWLLDERSAFAGRPPLLVEFEVTLADTTFTVLAVTLHMKCCADGAEQRQEASELLKHHLDRSLRDAPTIILGDFNDEIAGSTFGSAGSPYQNFVTDSQDYRFTTWSIAERDENTWCGNAACSSGSNLDHILITNELFSAYVENSTARLENVLIEIADYTETTSDHLPVTARFSFPTSTSREEPTTPRSDVTSVYPSPFTASAMVEYSIARPGKVVIELWDAVGRQVGVIEDGIRGPGLYRSTLEGAGLAAGVYFVVLRAGARHVSRQVIVVQ